MNQRHPGKHQMNHFSTLRLLGLAGLGALLAAPSFAQEAGYFYGGISAGQSRAEIDEERITAGLLGVGLSTTSMTRDERDTAFKLFGGYQFNRHFALEGGYFNLGKFGFRSTTVPAGTLTGQIKLHGINLDVVGTLPLTERFSLLGRVGAQSAQARDSFSGTGAVNVLSPNPSKRDLNYKLGVGFQYELSRSFLLRAEAERYRIDDAMGNRGDVNLLSVSLVVPFGRTPRAAPRAAAAPVEVARAPAPAPEPIVRAEPALAVVAAPVARQVSFSTDSVFGFDQWTLQADGKAALDDFLRGLKGTEYHMISVEGHTDRLGSQAYNQVLSTRRAEAVKHYLVTSGKIDAAKISAHGRGESKPVTRPSDCKGERATPKLVACLQPDRRVEVEVAGTR